MSVPLSISMIKDVYKNAQYKTEDKMAMVKVFKTTEKQQIASVN